RSGMNAPAGANLVLVVEIAMGIALLVGMMLARARRIRAHRNCQMTVVLLNLIPIALFMVPSFRRAVLGVPIAESGDLVPRVHAGLGITAELLGLYILLVAGTKLLPAALRFRRYKPWMRTELTLWWLVIAFG